MLTGKTVVVAVSGGIAAYKTCTLVSQLRKCGANVRVMLTKNATNFVTPTTFEALSGNRAVTDAFDRNFAWEVEHISFAKAADLVIVAPATANLIAKYAVGVCDDFVTTTLTATKAPVLICPAMNAGMLQSVTVQQNLKTLADRGVAILYGGSGWLACGDEGEGRMAEPDAIFDFALKMLLPKRDFEGKRVLVTAGGTRENIDPVRFIGNRSSGKMGAELARAAMERGAQVVLVAGHTSCDLPRCEVVSAPTTAKMFDEVISRVGEFDYIIKAAAPADYRPQSVSQEKIKDGDLSLSLVKNPDIAQAVGRNKGGCKLIIFCAESSNLLQNAKAKLKSKNADMVVANDVTIEGAGFDGDTNIATIIDRNGQQESGKITKKELANLILDRVARL